MLIIKVACGRRMPGGIRPYGIVGKWYFRVGEWLFRVSWDRPFVVHRVRDTEDSCTDSLPPAGS